MEPGDLLWTAEPGAFIPYATGRGTAENAAQWTQARNAAIAALRASSRPTDLATADAIDGISFEAFRAGYVEDRQVEQLRAYAGAGFAVGHVGLVDAGGQGLHIVEARPDAQSTASAAYARFKNGVVRTPYAEWIAAQDGSLVWHGRLRNASAADRAKVAAAARAKVGRDYWFWSFDLADTSSFYCSKLVWQAASETLAVALDGDRATARRFWVSPKRLMRQEASIAMLFSPAPYG